MKKLILKNENLTKLPESIAKLKDLEYLDLSNNQLKEIPKVIGELKKLKYLNLERNQLQKLPKEIGLLKKLQKLKLKKNDLIKIPQEISDLINLILLDLANNKLKQLPNISKLKKLKIIDISKNSLSKIPGGIFGLTQLTCFNLSSNKIVTLPQDIGNLILLTTLNIGENSLKKLPKTISQLKKLEEFYINENNLTKLPKEIISLKNLKILNLSNNQIEIFPKEIYQLTTLKEFDLSSNQIEQVHQELKNLSKLIILNLSNNQLKELPKEIGELKKLQELYVQQNRIFSLPEKIQKLTSLTTLFLSNNLLESVPSIKNLTKLTSLFLDNNQLTSLPEEIGNLKNLLSLELHNNKLEKIPESMKNLENKLTFLDLSRNKFLDKSRNSFNIPVEINTPQQIIHYILNTQNSKTTNLYQAKILFLGHEQVGKTTLIRKLMGSDPNIPKNKPTKGVNIFTKTINRGSTPIALNFWDFGSREVTSALHKLFMTPKSIYIIVFSSYLSKLVRYEELNAEYWLGLVDKYAKNSPVIIVDNQFQESTLNTSISIHSLKDKYPNIIDCLSIKSKESDDIRQLRKKIEEGISKINNLEVISENYLTVKNALATKQQNSISIEEYFNITQEQLSKTNAASLLEMLHNQGHLFKYKESNIYVLNRIWLINAVYTIIEESSQRRGIWNSDEEVLSVLQENHNYTSKDCKFFMDIMEKFQLCYRTYGGQYFIFGGFPKERPKFDWTPKQPITFQYKYNKVVDGLMSFFFKQSLKHIKDGTLWQYGTVIEDNYSNSALIEFDAIAKAINIEIEGPKKRKMVDKIRYWFETIHDDLNFSNQEVRERVPVKNATKNDIRYIDYEDLEFCDDKGVDFPVGAWKEFINVKQVLNGVKKRTIEPRKINLLVKELFEISVSEQDVNFALREINVEIRLIPTSSHLQKYYVNVIEYLISVGKFEDWLIEMKRFSISQEYLE